MSRVVCRAVLNVCFSYTARAEMVTAAQTLSVGVQEGLINVEYISANPSPKKQVFSLVDIMLTRLYDCTQGHQQRSAGGVHVHVRLYAAGHPHPHLRREEAQRFSFVAGTHRSFLWFRPLLTLPLLHHNAVRCARDSLRTLASHLWTCCGRSFQRGICIGPSSSTNRTTRTSRYANKCLGCS